MLINIHYKQGGRSKNVFVTHTKFIRKMTKIKDVTTYFYNLHYISSYEITKTKITNISNQHY